jgi:Zn-finger nucleic acid-binding protein
MEDLDLKGSLRCPADGAPLVPPATGGSAGESARACPACGGALFGQAQLARIIRHHGVDSLRAGAVPAVLRVCPGCGREMRVYAIAGIDIDACALCPCVWMDAGEFPAVKAALERMQAGRGQVLGQGPIPEPRIGPLDLAFPADDEPWLVLQILADLLSILTGGIP